MEMKPGFLARSLAGNDKGAVYEIQEDLGTHVLLLGPAGRPFKKNKKHVQLIISPRNLCVPRLMATTGSKNNCR